MVLYFRPFFVKTHNRGGECVSMLNVTNRRRCKCRPFFNRGKLVFVDFCRTFFLHKIYIL